jgi:isoquinoline 1-oxidoreductase alpha subunit
MATTLDVNGKTLSVTAAPDTPLLWVLRDELGLTGTKYGCGVGQCGACTVLADGQPIRSCLTPMSAVGAMKITTIESLGGSHPLQIAWVKNDVPQCGYCQSGQLMSAAGLLAATPHPTDEQITQAMDGNICRCGTYQRIHAAIKEAAAAPAAVSAA